MQRRLNLIFLLTLLVPLAGCAGFGSFVGDTANPFRAPHRVKNDSENALLAHGKSVPVATLSPAPGQPWPTSYPTDPTIMSIERSGSAVP
jgi:hypothetical protein